MRLSDILDSAMEDGNKVVVMVRFVAEMDAIEAMLQKKGIRYSLIRGGVNDRQEQIDRFQKEPSCKVFVGRIAAAGLGITLISGRRSPAFLRI